MRKHSVAALCAGLSLLVVVASFILLFPAIFFAYPLTVHVEEVPIVEIALRFLQTSDLNPHFFNYSSLIAHIAAQRTTKRWLDANIIRPTIRVCQIVSSP